MQGVFIYVHVQGVYIGVYICVQGVRCMRPQMEDNIFFLPAVVTGQ